MTEEMVAKGNENLKVLEEKELAIEAEIATRIVELKALKVRLKKVKALSVQLSKILTA